MGNNAKNSHKTHLSVIYFVDAKKTRSFSLSLTRLNIFLFSISAVVAWAGFSVYLVGSGIEKTDLLKDRLHASLNTIFEYQTRYDGVYELAYPRILHEIKAKQADLVKNEKRAHEAKAKGESVGDLVGKKPKIRLEDYAQKGVVDLEKKDFSHRSDPQWPVIVEEISYNRDQGDFELNFAIRNTQSPTRAEGYIWSIITVVDQDGKRSHVGSPSGVKVDDKGSIINPPNGSNWYSIRYYKAKSFYFQIPEGEASAVESIAISMIDVDGHKSEYVFPLEKNKIHKAGNSKKPDNEAEVVR